MAAAIQRTAPGHPRPGSGSTDAQARRAEPPQSDGLCPHPLRLPPEEHVMAPHQDHPNGASEPVSQPLLVLQQPHPSAASPHAAVSPAALAPGTPPPPAREVPHLHMHQQATNNKISVYTSKACAPVYQQHKYKSQKQEHFTYLYDRMPPQEATPCRGPSGSPLPHMGTGG
jgi:hypothetical protein